MNAGKTRSLSHFVFLGFGVVAMHAQGCSSSNDAKQSPSPLEPTEDVSGEGGQGSGALNGGDAPNPIGVLSVRVADTNTNAPIAGADVEIGGVRGTTNNVGLVRLANVPAGDRHLVVRADEYEATSQDVTLVRGDAASLSVHMPKYALIKAFKAEEGIAAKVGNFTFSLPPNAVKDPSGTLVKGEVTLKMAPIDPSLPAYRLGATSMKGEGLILPSGAGASGTQKFRSLDTVDATLLRSVGMAGISLFVGNQEVQLAASGTFGLCGVQDPAGTKVPVWSMSAKDGRWQWEGESVVVERPIMGECKGTEPGTTTPCQVGTDRCVSYDVPHLTRWNWDHPEPHSTCAKVTVLGPKGPVPNWTVYADHPGDQGQTDANGVTCVDFFNTDLGHIYTHEMRPNGAGSAIPEEEKFASKDLPATPNAAWRQCNRQRFAGTPRCQEISIQIGMKD